MKTFFSPQREGLLFHSVASDVRTRFPDWATFQSAESPVNTRNCLMVNKKTNKTFIVAILSEVINYSLVFCQDNTAALHSEYLLTRIPMFFCFFFVWLSFSVNRQVNKDSGSSSFFTGVCSFLSLIKMSCRRWWLVIWHSLVWHKAKWKSLRAEKLCCVSLSFFEDLLALRTWIHSNFCF